MSLDVFPCMGDKREIGNGVRLPDLKRDYPDEFRPFIFLPRAGS